MIPRSQSTPKFDVDRHPLVLPERSDDAVMPRPRDTRASEDATLRATRPPRNHESSVLRRRSNLYSVSRFGQGDFDQDRDAWQPGETMKSSCQEATLRTVRSASHLPLERVSAWSTSQSETSISVNLPSTWTVGKISLIFLVLAALGDLSLQQLQHVRHFEAYDALSADVIRPAFSYTSTNHARKSTLGSAAIGSVTEALSPILPFTGGVDLRREDYWTASPWQTMRSLYVQIADAFAISDSLGVAKLDTDTSLDQRRAQPSNAKADRPMVLSAPESFVSTQAIAALTLSDLTEVFRYAVESQLVGFDEVRFLKGLSLEMNQIIASFRDAVRLSRGENCDVSLVDASKRPAGSIDALSFSAAMRIFAEWRLLRQTPEGYKGFAVGMSLGHKDIVQNLVKIEQAVHSWLDFHAQAEQAVRSPTIAQLLQHEKERNIHPNLPRLHDKTAAMGLLWVRRQLHYQTRLFANALMVPQKFSNAKDAVVAAYNEVYNNYHGWAVQKIFHYSFQSAPDAAVIYRHMNPRKREAVESDLRKELLSHQAFSHDLSSKSMSENHVVAFFQDVGTAWTVANEQNREENPFVAFFQNVGKVFQLMADNNTSRPNFAAGNVEEQIKELVSAEMVKDASEHIALYIEVVQPLLDDLAEVFAKYNMDDPSKV